MNIEAKIDFIKVLVLYKDTEDRACYWDLSTHPEFVLLNRYFLETQSIYISDLYISHSNSKEKKDIEYFYIKFFNKNVWFLDGKDYNKILNLIHII